MSSLLAEWNRNVDISISVPEADHDGVGIRIGASRTVVRFYPVPGCAHETANSINIAAIALAQSKVDNTTTVPTSDYRTARLSADWWDDWKINFRKVLLATIKKLAKV